jgi:DNA-binding response OmpR family regulator
MINDGKLAEDSFKNLKHEICVLDIMLPSKDGYAIAQSIRKVDASVPIIFVTAKTQTEDVVKGFSVGGNDYLRKPFSIEELILRIDNLLHLTQKLANSKPASVSIGSFEFVPLRYELKGTNGVRKLSHREASLLQVLCENMNNTVTRKEILMKLWGDDSFFNSRNLDVYMAKLRDYLKADKGIGYQFVSGN